MKNNLILRVPGLAKIVKMFLVLGILFSVDFMNARAGGGKAGNNPIIGHPGQAPAQQVGPVPALSPITPTPSLARSTTNPFLASPSAPEDITPKLNWFLNLSYWTPDAEDHFNRDVLSPRSLFTTAQANQILNKKSQLLAAGGVPAATNPFAAPQFVPGKVKTNPFKAEKENVVSGQPSRFGSLFDYESYLSRLIPEGGMSGGMGALVGSVGILAAQYLAVPVIGAIGIMTSLKLAGGAMFLDRVAAGIRMGHWSRADAVGMVKNMFEQIINDGGAYPTFKTQIEGLKNPYEFSIVTKLDKSIIDDARRKLIQEVKEKQKKLNGPESANEKIRQDAINDEIARIQSATYAQGAGIKQYLDTLAAQPDVIRSQALVSELIRAKTHVGVMAAQAREKQAAKKKAAGGATEESKSSWKDYFSIGVTK